MKLIVLMLFALIPKLGWGQSSLPPCPEMGFKHRCVGNLQHANGDRYAGEFQGGSTTVGEHTLGDHMAELMSASFATTSSMVREPFLLLTGFATLVNLSTEVHPALNLIGPLLCLW